MTARTTRRAALGAILAAPLAASPAVAIPASGVSPELARLIRKSRVANARVDADIHKPGRYPYGSVRAAAVLRCRIARFKPAGMADALAKAKHTVALWGHECAQEEFEAATDDGTAYLDDMAHAVLLDLARLAGDGTP